MANIKVAKPRRVVDEVINPKSRQTKDAKAKATNFSGNVSKIKLRNKPSKGKVKAVKNIQNLKAKKRQTKRKIAKIAGKTKDAQVVKTPRRLFSRKHQKQGRKAGKALISLKESMTKKKEKNDKAKGKKKKEGSKQRSGGGGGSNKEANTKGKEGGKKKRKKRNPRKKI